ncbi:MAG: hypothetical protein KAR11_05215 [Phycisphaerae bacterium]|nr:hypothetical protein [Phycisphaerae bacterium]
MLSSIVTNGELFETIMLLCFGLCWPVSIFKALRTKMVHGKSVGFMCLVIVGYFSGATSKIVKFACGSDPLEFTIWLYFFNATLVLVDLILYLKLHKQSLAAAEEYISIPTEAGD